MRQLLIFILINLRLNSQILTITLLYNPPSTSPISPLIPRNSPSVGTSLSHRGVNCRILPRCGCGWCRSAVYICASSSAGNTVEARGSRVTLHAPGPHIWESGTTWRVRLQRQLHLYYTRRAATANFWYGHASACARVSWAPKIVGTKIRKGFY